VSDTPTDEIRNLLRRYIHWFSEGNSERIAREAYAAPFQAFLPTGVVAIPTPEGIQFALDAAMKAMRAAGYARSEMPDPVISMLNDTAAVVSGIVTRLRADGTTLETLGTMYLVGKTAAGWRILSVVAHDAQQVVRAVPVTA
jgi:hypothetical protein